MKVSKEKYAKMKAAMQAVVNHFGGTQNITLERLCVKSSTALLWRLWHIASDNLKYEDSHPAFRQGIWKRILPFDPTFDQYSDGDKDVHIETALKAISRELGIEDT